MIPNTLDSTEVHGLPARLARAWLGLGVLAITGAGVLAFLLVMARTPGVQQLIAWQDFFRSALIVHVDLSVLVWFLAFAGALWSWAGDARLAALGWAGVGLAALGTLLMALSPFFPAARPLLNNYVPVLHQPVFFAGLIGVGAGFACSALRVLFTAPHFFRATEAWRRGVFFAALCGLLALGALLASALNLPPPLEGVGEDAKGLAYFEMLFWGAGHTLQFQHAMLMLAAWWLLLDELSAAPAVATMSPRWLTAGFFLAAAPALIAPVIYALGPVGEAAHLIGFAKLMEWGHPWMLPLLLLLAAKLPGVWRSSHPAAAALWASALLFGAGGVLGYLIRGANVVIPAHYHGAIVGVTLAFMGLAYVLLPRLGYAPVKARLARVQPLIYGGGQLLHVLGLAVSGGYGVQRKVAGAGQVLTSLPQKIGMGMMGLGGLIAILGGILFVWIVIQSMRRGAHCTSAA